MEQYIPKSALVAKIEKLFEKAGNSLGEYRNGAEHTLISIKDFLDTLEVKEVDLEKELDKEWNKCEPIDEGMGLEIASIEHEQFDNIARHFFELGLKASNPITAADRGMALEIIINLKRVEQDYRINLTKEITWVRNKSQKG